MFKIDASEHLLKVLEGFLELVSNFIAESKKFKIKYHHSKLILKTFSA
jgi:hypothetical protein